MIRPDFQKATVISCVGHLVFFLMALVLIGLRSPHKSRVYTISLVTPAGTVATPAEKQISRTPPPKKVNKVKTEIPVPRTPAEKKPAAAEKKPEAVEKKPEAIEKKPEMALKKEDPEASQKKALEAIEKLRQEQKARDDKEAQALREEQTREAEEKQRLEELRNRLAKEGASDAESRIPEGERNDILNSYRDTIVPMIKKNWIFPEVGMGTRTEVSITVFADGTIRINRITTPSGNRVFDQSVLKAITKTGRVEPPPFGRNEDVTLNFIPVKK